MNDIAGRGDPIRTLQLLWSGAQPGSLGPLPQQAGATLKAGATPAAVSARTPDAAGKTTLK